MGNLRNLTIIVFVTFYLFSNAAVQDNAVAQGKAPDFDYIIKAAKAGDNEAQYILGRVIYESKSPSEDLGLYYLKQSAMNGNAEANLFLGEKSQSKGNHEQAYHYYSEAAQMENAIAQYKLYEPKIRNYHPIHD